MGKIKKSATAKHNASLPFAIKEFVKTSTTVALFELPEHLATFPRTWPLPRGDLHHWIPTLNRFDTILELFNERYGLSKGPQTQVVARQILSQGDGLPSTTSSGASQEDLDRLGYSKDGDRELVEAIVEFTRLLFDKCSSRSLYSSSSHVSNLLNSSSLTLVESALRLGLCLAQRYASRNRSGANQHHHQQQQLNHSLLASHYAFDLEHIESLAQPFTRSLSSTQASQPIIKEVEKNSIATSSAPDLLSIVREDGNNGIKWEDYGGAWVSLDPESGSESHTGFADSGHDALTPSANRITAPPGGSQPASPTEAVTNGIPAEILRRNRSTVVEVTRQQIISQSIETLLSETIPKIPVEKRSELLEKIRAARAMSHSIKTRRHLVAIRLLAIANLANVYPEHLLQTKVLQHDSEGPRSSQLPQQLCDLVHPPGGGSPGVPKELQSIALLTLAALTKHRVRASDVSAALSVNVSHGMLSFLARKGVTELEIDESEKEDLEDREWRDSLFFLLHELPKTNTRVAEGFVAGGLLEILAESLVYRTNKAEANHPRVLRFLDYFIFNKREAFQTLANTRGLDALSDLAEFEVNSSLSAVRKGHTFPTDFRSRVTDFDIPFLHQQTLSQLLKFVNHMIANSQGAFDRQVRNLIESSQMLNSLKILMQNPVYFGSEVWSLAVNVFSSYLHNEPTSFNAMAEAGVSQALLETITQKMLPATGSGTSEDVASSESTFDGSPLDNKDANAAPGILPTMDAISCLPEAFGAICLAEAGMRQFESSDALQTFFKIFISPAHQRCLSDPHADVEDLGTSMDEIARHHPRLRPRIVTLASQLVHSISTAYSGNDTLAGARLLVRNSQFTPAARHPSSTESDERQPSGNVTSTANDVEMSGMDDAYAGSSNTDAVAASASQTVGILSHFLLGFLINPNMIAPFAETSGIEDLLNLATSPVLPYNFNGGSPGHAPGHGAIFKLIQVFHNLIEHKPHMILPSMVRRALLEAQHLEEFLGHTGEETYFVEYLRLTSEDSIRVKHGSDYGTSATKSLLNLQTLCSILSKSLTPTTNRSNQNWIASVNLTDMYVVLIPLLGRLQSSCLWEFMRMQPVIPSSFKRADTTNSDESNTSGVTSAMQRDATNPMQISPTQDLYTTLLDDPQGAETQANRSHGMYDDTRWATSREEHNYLVIRHFLRNLPPTIASFFATLGKSLVLRRGQMETYQKQNNLLVADRIAEALVTQLDGVEVQEFPSESADFVRYICLTHIGRSMLDKRTDAMDRGSSQILTMVVNAFKKRDGFVKLGKTLAQLFEGVVNLLKRSEEARGSRNAMLACRSIDVILKMFAQLTNDKKISEAPQTLAMASRVDRDRDRPDFFLAAHFLVELRFQAIQAVSTLWYSEEIQQLQDTTVKTITEILRNVLEGEGEGGAFKRADKAPEPGHPPRKRWRIRSMETLGRLTAHGYNQDLAEEALYRCNDSFPASQEYCAAYTRNSGLVRYPIPSYDAPASADIHTQSQALERPDDNSAIDESLTPATAATLLSASDPSEQNTASPANERPVQSSEPSANEISSNESRSMTSDAANLELPQNSYLIRTEDLEEKRSELRDGLMDRCLTALDAFQSLTFELADLIIGSVNKSQDPLTMRQDICETLVQSLISFQGSGSLRANAQKIEADAHLLGVVLQEKDFFEAAKDNLRDSLSGLLGFLTIEPDQKPEESPSWIAPVLLVIEKIMAEDSQPHQIQWTPPTSDQPDDRIAQLPEPLVPPEEKKSLFDMLVDILPRVGKDSQLGLAIMRTLVSLTRDRSLAKELGMKRNMQRLFVMVKQLSGHADDKLQAVLMLVLRHVIEDDDTIRQIVRTGIQNLFEKPPRQLDTTTYTRNLYHLVLRAPNIFVETTNELLMLSKFDRNQNPQTLILKKGSPSASSNQEDSGPSVATNGTLIGTDGEDVAQQSMEIDQTPTQGKIAEGKAPAVANPDGVIHFLLSELLAYKEVADKAVDLEEDTKDTNGNLEAGSSGPLSEPQANTQSNAAGNVSSKSKSPFNASEHPIYIYRCLLLQCLTELLQSYSKTKIEFTNFSRKADPQAATPSKPHSGVLNYMLNSLIPVGTLNHPTDTKTRKDAATSSWAMRAVAALVSRTDEKALPTRRADNDRDDEPELLFVRKFVLEHVLRAFRDANGSTDPFDVRYSRMLSIADLLYNMLAEKPRDASMRPGRDQRDDKLSSSQKDLAKIMFEKNFIPALTSSISDVDLNVAGVNRAVKHILRPLKLLTQTAIDLSMTSELSSSSGPTDEDEISSATSLSETAEDREETPDLFRHSTLGMFEPGRNDEPSSESDDEDDDEDEEMYGDAYADDMDYDEGEEVEDDEDVSDEDAEMTEMGPVEGLPGDINMDVEIELEEDDGMSSSDGEDDDEDDDDGEDDDASQSQSEDDEDGNEDDMDDAIELVEGAIAMGEGSSDGGDLAEDDEWLDNGESMPFGIHISDPSQGITLPESQTEHEIGLIPARDDPLDGGLEIDVDQAATDSGDSEGDGDEDEDEFDEDEEREMHVTQDFGIDEDDDVPPWFWPITPGRRHAPHHHFPRIHGESFFVPSGERPYRSHRPTGPAHGEDGMNPLLQRNRPGHWPATQGSQHTARQANRITSPWNRLNQEDLHQAVMNRNLPPIGRNNPMSYLSELLNALSQGGAGVQGPLHHHHPDGTIHFSIPAVPANMALGLPPPDIDPLLEFRQDVPNRSGSHDPANAVSFSPSITIERWQAEARLLFGSSYTEKCSRVINSILKLLVPPAIEAERIQKEKEAEQRKKAEEEQLRQKAEQEAKEKQEREEREAREKAQAEAAAAAAAAEQEASEQAAPHESTDGHAADTSEAMDGVETSIAEEATANDTTASAAEAAPRVYTNIRGRQLDITDLGIDLAYLDALPDEMREEVIMQQYAEQRSQAAASGEEPTAINREFLDALPPDIREELLQQEAQDRRRREREEARRQSATGNGGTAQPVEMDPASFITSLDPVLRQSVLADADEEMLASLPAEYVAEARALGGHRRRPLDPARLLDDMDFQEGRGASHRLQGEDMQRMLGLSGRPQRRPVVHMMDKAGVATLLRLMFVSITGNARQNLNGILRNICGNRQTRGEVVTGLLSILQEGSTDVVAVERSFAQLTLRAKQSGAVKTPQTKSKSTPILNTGDSSPLTVTGQCLNALVFLTQTVTHISHFFLSENDTFGGLKPKSSKKGKSKESKGNKYPINALLSLLGRNLVVENASIVEQLAGLLQTITHPLNAMKQAKAQITHVESEASSSTTQVVTDRPQLQDQQEDNEVGTTNVPESTSRSSANDQQSGNQDISTTTAAGTAATHNNNVNSSDPSKAEATPTDAKKSRSLNPPEIPEENLQLVINILMARDCSSKTFRDTLSLITNLSAIPNAKKVFGDELVKCARELGQKIYADLLQLIKSLKGAENEMQAQSLALANFSPAGSDQSKFNRILTALDYLFDVKAEGEEKSGTAQEAVTARAGEDLLSNLNDDPSFGKLWGELSEALSATQQSGHYFFNVATILLPLIEALMVVCKRLPLKESSSLANRNELGSPMSEVSMMVKVFFSFTNRHRKILNDLVRHTPKLMSGSFAALVKNSSVLEFDNKRNYFSRRLHQRSANTRHAHSTLQVNVRREQVFLDSYTNLHYKKPDEIKYGKLHIRFQNEEGVDAGGVTREWFSVLARQMFNPDYALFNPVASDKTTFHPNPLSEINEQHLHFFKFIGRIIGKALYENRVLDCHFSRAVYKRILGKPVSIKDMETIDLDYSKSMEWILENDITDIITETFSVAFDRFGVEQVVDLIPNGRNIPVTEDNKHEFVRLVIEYKLTGAVKDQLENFLSGFHDIIPPELISIFDENELELLISGMPDVDVDDWKNNTEYHNYTANSAQVQWFWRAVRSFDKEERAKLLQFVTGAGKVPLNGFKELEGMNGITRFSIHKDYGNKERLPSSHTCFNQLDLPEYESYEFLRKNLYTAMTTGNEYFGYA